MGYLANLDGDPGDVLFSTSWATKGWARAQGWLDDAELTVRYIGGEPELVDLPLLDIEAQMRSNDENFAVACEGLD